MVIQISNSANLLIKTSLSFSRIPFIISIKVSTSSADLFLVNISDIDVGFISAINWLLAQNVNIISSSIGINLKLYCYLLHSAFSYPYVSGYIANQINYLNQIVEQWDHTINKAVSKGITWSQAAGNDGQKRWKGWKRVYEQLIKNAI